MVMKDFSALTRSFQEWSALLDFLMTRNQPKEISEIHIERAGGKTWTMKINATNVKPRSKTRGVGMFDLYW